MTVTLKACVSPCKAGCEQRPTWFRNLVVKEMPNLVGMSAMPRLRKRLAALNSAMVPFRASNSDVSHT